MRIYSVQRETMYMRNKFMPQPYVPNELNLKRRVETTLPSDQVVDMVKGQPYWKVIWFDRRLVIHRVHWC
jgi:hypothetical protein